MDESKRRSRIGRANKDGESEINGSMAEVCADAAAYLLGGSIDRMLTFGPVVWRPSDGTSARQWCFIVAGCGCRGPICEIWWDQLDAETEADTVAFRKDVMAALVKQRPDGPLGCITRHIGGHVTKSRVSIRPCDVM